MNPFANILGLSLFVHLLVLLVRKNFISDRPSGELFKASALLKYSSALIIMVVSGFIICGAVMILAMSVTDTYSTIRIASSAFEELHGAFSSISKEQPVLQKFTLQAPVLPAPVQPLVHVRPLWLAQDAPALRFTNAPLRLASSGMLFEQIIILFLASYLAVLHARALRRFVVKA